jgi:hypothetical protein
MHGLFTQAHFQLQVDKYSSTAGLECILSAHAYAILNSHLKAVGKSLK